MTLKEVLEQYNKEGEARDVAFIFAWQLARVLAHGHARGHDAELLSDRLVSTMMGHLDANRYDPERGPLAPFLTYICWRPGLRASYEIGTHRPTGDMADIEQELENEILTYEGREPELDRLRREVEALPNPNWVRMMKLKYDDHMTAPEIAEVMGVKPTTIDQWHSRALVVLRERMVT